MLHLPMHESLTSWHAHDIPATIYMLAAALLGSLWLMSQLIALPVQSLYALKIRTSSNAES